MEEIYVGRSKKKGLNQAFEKHTKNGDAIIPNGSTCANESFSPAVASKASKMHHYSKLESFDPRIVSAVCQKKDLSPGKISHKF